MEQYWMPKKLDFKNLRLCLDNYTADFLYIRLVGSMGGTVKVNERLENRVLDFKKDKECIHFIVDNKEVFRFSISSHKDPGTKGFSLAYERFEKTGGYERMVMLSTGIDPYDPKLPEPRRSFLRHVMDDHLLEIFFKGRIHLKFHSWWQEPYWKYWTIAENINDTGKE